MTLRPLMTSIEPETPPTSGSTERPVLALEHLSVAYTTRGGMVQAVRDVSLAIGPGETLGIVGESGCGKSSLAYAVMGYLGDYGRITAGSIRLQGQELTTLPRSALQRLRGARMAMVYQDPHTALNPALVVGEQVAEAHRAHTGRPRPACWARAVELLRRVGLPDPERVARRYPHQLSGGQQQRVVIAMALINDPALLIMDEPTTALDATTQALILDLVNDLKRETRAAILYISHDLGVIAQVCDRVAVMYAGAVVEEAETATLFRHPRHPYTVGLLRCLPRPGDSKAVGQLEPIPGRLPPATAQPEGCAFAPRCALAQPICRQVAPPLYHASPSGAPGNGASVDGVRGGHLARCHFWVEVPAWARSLVEGGDLPSTRGALAPGARRAGTGLLLEVRDLHCLYGDGQSLVRRLLRPLAGGEPPVRAVDGVSFDLAPGETLALVGETGCGKTTLARTIAGLLEPTAGTIRFEGTDIVCAAERRPLALRRDLQMVFQNPQASLNPRHTVGQIVGRPVERLLGLRGRAAEERVRELLEAVQLDAGYSHRYPGQLSGGEQQRVSIARAFAADPRLVICDEAVSALDVSVQAAILNLLASLQAERGTSYLFISHDLRVVRYLADRIAVMYLGKIVEIGRTEDLFRPPHHPYTEALLSATPLPEPPEPDQTRPRIRLEGPVPSPTARPAGCPFAGRCPRSLGRLCDEVPPPVRDAGRGHQIACHLPLEELARPQAVLAPGPKAALA